MPKIRELSIMDEFEGKVALVTGSSRGIGRTTALLLAQSGANVVINYRSDERCALGVKAEIEELGRNAIVANADVGRLKDVERMFNLIFDTFKRVDVLINNAGFVKQWAPIEKISEDDWDGIMDVNLKGMFMCTKFAVPAMKKNGGGVIINIGSQASQLCLSSRMPYRVSKNAVSAITKSLAVELGRYNIRVNCVAPGPIGTKDNVDDPGFAEKWSSYVPLGRVGSEMDIAEAVLFLCSSKAAFITGQTIGVDGGTTAYILGPEPDFVKIE